MFVEPAPRASAGRNPRSGFEYGGRRDRRRGLSGLLVAGVAFAATVTAGLYVVDLVRDFGQDEAALIEAAGSPP